MVTICIGTIMDSKLKITVLYESWGDEEEEVAPEPEKKKRGAKKRRKKIEKSLFFSFPIATVDGLS